ncbi:hypothetical protein QYE76_065638 [Lolium multiflorum]|uniref:CCHC-type domain-containing protein n=1 Tax=Lolium multiflorum TaxID=4521 RepID=A0AAD8SAP5_LOLMU|nr:hypothetical protein QYE76_065638 [Lolium multiflorum]
MNHSRAEGRDGPQAGLRPTDSGPAKRQFIWLWMPAGCPIPELGFPARASEVRQRLQDPTAPPHRLLRQIQPPTPLSRSFAAVLMERGEEGRKRRLDEPGRRAVGEGYGRRDGEASWRQDLGRSDGGYRYQDGDQGYRYQDRDREGWEAPPQRWREQPRREEALDVRQGDREGYAGQGDRVPRSQAKAKGKKNSGNAAGAAPQKGKNKVGQAKAGAPVAGECFKCGREGHYQSECQFEPLCVICSGEGHSSVSCPSRGKTLRLQSMGHAITGGGFYNINVEPLKAGQASGETFTAVIKFNGEPLSEDKLSEELKLLVDDLWDWQVTKQTESEFTVVFPSRATLRLATACGKLFLPISEKETTIREAFLAPKPSLVLPSTWVRLTGVPEDLLTKERLMAAFVMVGRPVVVDELLIMKRDREPIRIRFQGRYPERMKGSVQVFVNGEGFTVMLQVEEGPRGGAGGSMGGPPPPPRPDQDDVDSEEMSSDDEWNKHRKKSSEQDKEKGKGTDLGAGKSSGQSGARKTTSQSAPPASRSQGGSVGGLLQSFDQYGTNLGLGLGRASDKEAGLAVGAKTLAVDALLVPGSGVQAATKGSLVSTETDSQVTDPLSSWVAESPSMGAPPTKITRMSSPVRELEADKDDWVVTDSEEEGDGEREVVVAPATHKNLLMEAMGDVPLAQGRRSKAIPYTRKNKEVVAAVRKSGRHGGADAGTPALEKAQRLAAEKNLEIVKGKDKAKGMDFTVLDVLPDSHLSSVVRDSCLIFHPKAGAPREAQSLVRAKEAVQAALAETRHRLEAEELARREASGAVVAGATTSVDAGTSAPNPTPSEAPGVASGEEDLGGSVEAATRPVPIGPKGRPRRSCVKVVRPMLTVRKGQTKRKGSR